MSYEAGVKFTELQNQLKKLRADISLKHPVSILIKYKISAEVIQNSNNLHAKVYV